MRRETRHHTGIAKAAITAALTGAMTLSGAMAISGMSVVAFAAANVASIDGTNYETLEAAVAAAQDGDTITLLQDCAGNGIIAPQGQFNSTGLTIDFGGHTYTMDGEMVGSTGTKTQAFQLLKDNKITFKNGTILSAKAKMLVQNYSDLTLDNMTLTLNNPDYAYAYTLSNNNGNVLIKDSTINPNPAGKFAFDVCRYSSYPSVHVTVTGTSQINGDIEVSASGNDAKDGFSLNFDGGTCTGDIVLDDSAKAAMTAAPEKATITRAAAVAEDAPDGYQWQENEAGKFGLVPLAVTDGADETSTGNNTAAMVINDAVNQSYKLYRVFNATVTKDTTNSNVYKASNVSWASTEGIQNAIMNVITNEKYGDDRYTGTDNPQAVAEWISSHISAQDELAKDLATALAGLTPTETLTSGTPIVQNYSGYYLAVAGAVADGQSGTSAIWIPYVAEKGKIYEIQKKTSTVQFTKTASEGTDNDASVVDAGIGEAVTFTLTAKLPENYASYTTYKVSFQDTLPAGLTYVADSGSVKLNNEGNSIVPVVNSGTNLTAEIANLKAKAPNAEAGDEIVMTYTATLNNTSTFGLTNANVNTATLTYSNDPHSDETGTLQSQAEVATYQLNILKVDKGTNAPLANIAFTVKQGDKWVQSDGSLGTSAYRFVTDPTTGAFSIPRVDAGTYVLNEINDTDNPLPDGYTAIQNLSVEIKSALSGTTPSLTVNATDANVEEATADTASGIVSIKVSNTKEIVLPITGMTPSQLASKLGIVMIVAGGALMLVYVSKNKKKSEDK